jgi:hypothetical protein
MSLPRSAMIWPIISISASTTAQARTRRRWCGEQQVTQPTCATPMVTASIW